MGCRNIFSLSLSLYPFTLNLFHTLSSSPPLALILSLGHINVTFSHTYESAEGLIRALFRNGGIYLHNYFCHGRLDVLFGDGFDLAPAPAIPLTFEIFFRVRNVMNLLR